MLKKESNLKDFYITNDRFYGGKNGMKQSGYLILNDWTLEDEKLIYGVLYKYAHMRIALSKLFNDYISKLRKIIGELKNDKISKKLITELSSVDVKYIWKYDNIWKYCNKLNQLYGTKNEKLPSHVDTLDICYFISFYEKLGEFFINHTPQNIASKYMFSSLFDRWESSTINIEVEILRYVIDNYGEELTDEFLKILN